MCCYILCVFGWTIFLFIVFFLIIIYVSVLPPPGEISILSVKPDSVTLTWGPPEGLDGPKMFRVTCEGDGEQKNITVTDMYKVEITGLQSGQKYEFQVSTEGEHENLSDWVSKTVTTGTVTFRLS